MASLPPPNSTVYSVNGLRGVVTLGIAQIPGLADAIASAGTTNHAELDNLDFAGSGHTGFAPAAHTHALGDVTGLVDALAAKSAVGHTHGLASADLTGTLPVTKGGTGVTAVAAGNVLYATGANTLAAGTPDAAGLVPKTGGTFTGLVTFDTVRPVFNSGIRCPGPADFEANQVVARGHAVGWNNHTHGWLVNGWGKPLIIGTGTLPVGVSGDVVVVTKPLVVADGQPVTLAGLSSTNTTRDRAAVVAEAVDNTDATRKYRVHLAAFDTVQRNGVTVEATGTGVRVLAPGLPTHADNAAATTAGLAAGTLYRTSGGELRVVV